MRKGIRECLLAFVLTIVTIGPPATYTMYEDHAGTIMGMTFCLPGHECDD